MEEKFETIDDFCSYVCNCACSNDWYCPKECELLQKTRKIPFDKINDKWIEHDGDIKKVARYIKNYKTKGTQLKFDLVDIPKNKQIRKTISKKWKQKLQEYCDKQSQTEGTKNGYCVCGYMEYCDLCEGGDKDLPCVKPILQLAKKKNIKLNDQDFDFEKLLTEDL